MEDATPDPRVTQARNRRRITMIIFLAVGVAEIILAIYNGAGHRWGSMAANILILIAIGMAIGLLTQHQRGKKARE